MNNTDKRMAKGKRQVGNGTASSLAICHFPFPMLFAVLLTLAQPSAWAAPTGGNFDKGLSLYQASRNSEAIDAFEQAIKRKERTREAQAYIDRIRKETVERIRNKALTGVSKSTWQNKYYFMNRVDNRVHVGISIQEMFERDSLNFRPGAVESLNQLAGLFAKAKGARFEVDVINEITAEGPPPDPILVANQLNAIFSYLSLASRSVLPKF